MFGLVLILIFQLMCFTVMNHVQDNQRKSARKLVKTTFKIFKKIRKINSSKIFNTIIKCDLSFGGNINVMTFSTLADIEMLENHVVLGQSLLGLTIRRGFLTGFSPIFDVLPQWLTTSAQR